jgi:FkbM family methyltransferase
MAIRHSRAGIDTTWISTSSMGLNQPGENMKQFAGRFLIRISANPKVQRFLERNVRISQYLLGIGSESFVGSSGEEAILKYIRGQTAGTQPLCIFDVGANQGQFLRLVEEELRGVSLQIHAFEPSEFTYQRLLKNSQGFNNVTLNHAGLGKSASEMRLFYDEPGSGLASLSKRKLEHFGIDFKYSEQVRIDTLDDYCEKHAIQTIDLLKLDVEGHELDVLQGGLHMFNRRKVRMISFEFGGCNIDSRTFYRDYYEFFKE